MNGASAWPSAPSTEPPFPPRLGAFQRWSWRAFGHPGEATPAEKARAQSLSRAHLRIEPEEYAALLRATTLFVGAVTGPLGVALAWLAAPSVGIPWAVSVAAAIPICSTATAYGLLSDWPDSRARERGRRIDRSLAAGANFVAALSCANARIDEIFRELADQPLHGELAEEAAWIVRDTDLLGRDIYTAIRDAARRSPSLRLQEFLQGIVTTAESGGELRPYFFSKADQYEREALVLSQGRLERMGALAEAFVAVGVAFPIFLMVLLAIVALLDGASSLVLTLVWVTALGVVPLLEIGFGLLFQSYGEQV